MYNPDDEIIVMWWDKNLDYLGDEHTVSDITDITWSNVLKQLGEDIFDIPSGMIWDKIAENIKLYRDGRDKDGFDRVGYGEDGFNSFGLHRNGTRYDVAGFDINRIHKKTGAQYDEDGFDYYGLHRNGTRWIKLKDSKEVCFSLELKKSEMMPLNKSNTLNKLGIENSPFGMGI
jgi:hypothetical protein